MAEEVDPAEAAPAGHGSDFSDALATGADIADIACDAGAPIDPAYAVAEEIDLSSKRLVVYRAGSVGRVKTII
eukprot:6319643-Pyramimonas_sp.AAC.1